MKKKFMLIVSLTAVLLLAGCWDVKEPQRMYYIDGIGIDYKDGQYEIYMQNLFKIKVKIFFIYQICWINFFLDSENII